MVQSWLLVVGSAEMDLSFASPTSAADVSVATASLAPTQFLEESLSTSNSVEGLLQGRERGRFLDTSRFSRSDILQDAGIAKALQLSSVASTSSATQLVQLVQRLSTEFLRIDLCPVHGFAYLVPMFDPLIFRAPTQMNLATIQHRGKINRPIERLVSFQAEGG